MTLPAHKPSPARDAWEFQGDARFEVRRRLGSGGFGTVFEVDDKVRGAKVALKMLRRLEAGDLYRFKQEFRALADLTHLNLVQLYELSGDGDHWFFTMELVEGDDILSFVRSGQAAEELASAPTLEAQSLAALPVGAVLSANDGAPARPAGKEPRRFDEPRVRSALTQLVEGVAALHAAGQIHRDVKPSNVLVTRDGRVVIVDFGLAVRLSSSAAQSRAVLVGTPEYLAPEMIRGASAGPATDWYAVGVLLYEALAGRSPFTGSITQILGQKLETDPPPPSALVEGVPPDLDALCAELMARDPARRPAGSALLARVGAAPAPRSGPRETPFVGRQAERAALDEIFGPVEARSKAAVALVGGPSGIGKTALVDRVATDLRRRAPGALLLSARCYEQESVPYKAIDGLVDPLSRHLKQLAPQVAESILPPDVAALAWLFPVLRQVEAIADGSILAPSGQDAPERRRRALGALRELLSRLARRCPLVVVIDDLQWGDRDSALLLLDLLAPPSPPPLLLLVTYRSDEAETSACLRTLLPGLEAMRGPALHVASLMLGALAEPEARALAKALVPKDRAGDEDLCAAISREARGRPFLVRELCELSGERAALSSRAEEVSVDALVRARVAALPEGPRRLLELLAVAGRPVDRAAAMRAAELGNDGPSAYLLLRNARMIRRRDAGDHDELEPYHDRVREAVAAGLSDERRADCSRRLAAALEGTGRADPETLAAYYRGGGDRARAAELVAVAALRAARALAFDRAARLYRQALELRPESDAESLAMQESLGEALSNGGRGAEAAEAFVAAAKGAPPDRAFELHRRAAELLLAAGHVDDGFARLRGCLAETGLRVPRWAPLASLFLVVWIRIRGLRYVAQKADEVPAAALRRIDACQTAARALNGVAVPLAAYFSFRAVLLALAAGEPRRIFEALTLSSLYTAALRARPEGAVERAMEVADKIAQRLDLPEAAAMRGLIRGASANMHGRMAAARAELPAVVQALEELPTGRLWATNLAHEFSFGWMLWTGAWSELSARLPPVLAEARGRGNRWLERSLLLRFAHAPLLLADDPEGAARVHAEAREGWWPPRFALWDGLSMMVRADLHLYTERGRGAAAHRLVEATWPALMRSGLMRIRGIAMFLAQSRARAALAFAANEGAGAGERKAALAAAASAARRLVAIDNPLSRGFARLAEAGLASARGDDRAVAAWARAEEALLAAECRHIAAAAKRRRGALTGGAEGAALVAEADAWLAAEGARDPAGLAAMMAPG